MVISGFSRVYTFIMDSTSPWESDKTRIFKTVTSDKAPRILVQGVRIVKQDFSATASEFLQSEKGNKVKNFAASPAGQQIRSQYAQQGEALRAAVKRGDMASAEIMLKRILESKEGQKLAEQLKQLMD